MYTEKRLWRAVLRARGLDLIPLTLLTAQLLSWALFSALNVRSVNFSLLSSVSLSLLFTLLVVSRFKDWDELALTYMSLGLILALFWLFSLLRYDLKLEEVVQLRGAKVVHSGKGWAIIEGQEEYGGIARLLLRSELRGHCDLTVRVTELEGEGGFSRFLRLSLVAGRIREVLDSRCHRRVKSNPLKTLLSELGAPYSDIIGGLIWGWRDIPKALKEKFIGAGIYHLMVASGGNVLAVGYIAHLIFSLLGFTQSKLVGLIAMFLYLVIAGPDYPLVRGFLLGALIFSDELLRFKLNTYRALLWIWLIMSLLMPTSSSSWSFLMSFLATAVLINLSQRDDLRSFLYTVFSVWLSMVPITLMVFGGLSLLAPLANLLAIPLTSSVIPLGFLWYLMRWLGVTPVSELLGVLLKLIAESFTVIADLTSWAYLKVGISSGDVQTYLQSLAYLYVLSVMWFLWWRDVSEDVKFLKRITA